MQRVSIMNVFFYKAHRSLESFNLLPMHAGKCANMLIKFLRNLKQTHLSELKTNVSEMEPGGR